jgi:DNA polymerase-1
LEDRGLLPKQFSDYQVLIGDSTDNVPSLMAPKKSMAVLKEHGTLKNWFETKEGKTFFLAHTSELIRNKQLIRMSHKCWAPTEGDLKLSPISSNDHFIKEEFGNLPASLTSLRSINSPKKSLF